MIATRSYHVQHATELLVSRAAVILHQIDLRYCEFTPLSLPPPYRTKEVIMLAIVVLFTIFIGLVGLLATIGECQKRRRSSAEKKREKALRERLARVKGWLSGHGLDVPSGGQVMALLNTSLKQAPSKVSGLGWEG